MGLGADWRKMIGENHLVTYGLDLDQRTVVRLAERVEDEVGIGGLPVPTLESLVHTLDRDVAVDDRVIGVDRDPQGVAVLDHVD